MVCENFVPDLKTKIFRGNFVKYFAVKLLQNIFAGYYFLPNYILWQKMIFF